MTTFDKMTAAAVIAMLTLLAGNTEAEERSPGTVQAGSLLFRMAAGYETATLLDTEVDLAVSGLVARATVRQAFRNEGSEWVEGIYVFPLPDAAAVDHMRVRVGDRIVEGEIREKEAARKAYEKAKQSGRKASLVEQQRANLFTTSVANIAPGERIVVEIEYLDTVRYEDGLFSLRVPLTLTPRYIPGSPLPDRQGSGWSADTDLVPDASTITPPMLTDSRGQRVTIDTTIDAGLPLSIIASRYHPVAISEDGNRYRVALATATAPMDHDFELVWRPVASEAPRAMVFNEQVNGEEHFLLMVMPPDAEEGAALVPRETIFVIDTSGSMHGVSIEQARGALDRALDGLAAGDRFNVIEFNSIARTLYPASRGATPGNVSDARRFVAGLDANGGTEMRTALELALATAPSETHLRQIVFITDGSIGNEEELYRIIETGLGPARLFTVGIGSAPNSWFMRKAAELGRGTFTIISSQGEIGEKVDRLLANLAHPQVTGIDVRWPGGVAVDSYPSIVPDLYPGEPVAVRARVTGPLPADPVVTVSGDSIAGAWQATLGLPVAGDDAGVGALWARARIGALLDDGRRGRDAELVRRDVIDTALAHHLVSRYTSLVAVDKTPVRPAGEALTPEQIANLLPYGQSTSAIFGFPATATNSRLLLLCGIITVLLALALSRATSWRGSRAPVREA